MYIVVVGGGKVGYYLSVALLSEGHELLILEKDPDKCGAICEDLGSVVMRGDGCEARTLEDVGKEFNVTRERGCGHGTGGPAHRGDR